MLHAEATQVAVPCTLPHSTPHLPQFAGSLLMAVSHPVATCPSQSPNPSTQSPMAHAPDLHTPLAFAGAHAAPHFPQFAALVCTSTHAPAQHCVAPVHGCDASQLGTHVKSLHACPVGH
jgi:hypothetical protein